MEKIKKIFKRYSAIYFTILLILTIVGITLAVFTFTNASKENILSLGQISMSYEEPSNAYVVDDALPMKDEVAMKTSKYFEFKVTTHATTNVNDNTGLEIPYEINLGELAIDSGMTKLTKEQVKLYLTKVEGGVETEVIRPRKLSSFTTTDNGNAILYKTYDIHKNAGSSITTTYRLRAWVNYDMDINLFTGTTKYQYKFNVNINAEVDNLVKEGTLLKAWRDYTSNENNYLAIYTLDKKEMPSTYTYNNVTYTKTSEIDVSSNRDNTVILGEYKDTSGNIIALMGQDGGVIAPIDSSNLFSSLTNLTNLDLSNLDTKNVTNMELMFYNSNKLVTLDVSKFNTSKVTTMRYMFRDCSSLTSLDVSGFDTKNVTNMARMFQNLSKIKELDVTNFDTRNVTDMHGMFLGMSSLVSLNLVNFNTSSVETMYEMFQGMSSLTTLDLSNFNTINVTQMYNMFYGLSSLTKLDLSSFNTSKVTSMERMFYNCKSLTKLDLSSFNTSKVTNMYYMFRDCSSLTSLDVSSFDTRNVTTMARMFDGLNKIKELDVTNFDTRNVTDMHGMFNGMNSLVSLDISNFNTSNTKIMYELFKGMSSLTSLDLSSFNTSKVESTYDMFQDMSSLTTIYVSDLWTTTNVTNSDYMFYNCPKIVGGNGTKYNTSYLDKTYARIDKTGEPGYLTYKQYPVN